MHARHAAIAVLLACAASHAPPASADPGAWPSALQAAGGAAFTFSGGEPDRRMLEDAIERAVAEMSFLIRPFARSRLTQANRIRGRMWLRLEGAELVVDRDGSVVRSPASGEPARWTDPDGKAYVVRQVLRGRELVQRFTSEDGERLNTLSLSDDGRRLRLAVEVRSARLPAPLCYELAYEREVP